MDPATLAASAVGFLAAELVRLAGKGFEDAASARIYQLVSTQLRKTELGQQIFERFEGNPASIPHQAELTGAVTTQVTDDAEFATALREAVDVLNAKPEDGASEKNTVRFAGTMTRSTITQAETIDKSKRRYSFGSIPTTVVAIVALLVIGSGGYGAYRMTQPAHPDLEGNWHGKSQDSTMLALHFTGDRFSLDADAGFAQMHCAGTVQRKKEKVYSLTTEQGACPGLTATVAEDEKTLSAAFANESANTFVKQE